MVELYSIQSKAEAGIVSNANHVNVQVLFTKMAGIPGQPGIGTDFLGAQFGLMSNLRTGNIILDTAICLAIPLVFGFIVRLVDQAKIWWDVSGHGYFSWTNVREFRRVIQYEKLTTSWGNEVPAPNSWNNLLQKAVTLYISKHLTEKRIKVHRGAVSLLTVEHQRGYYYNDESGDGNSPADQLKKYRMACEPETNVWSEIEPNLFFERREIVNDDQGHNGNLTRSTIIFTFRCASPHGDEVIQLFLDKAYAYYQDELRKQQDSSRYFYNMISGPTGSGGGEGNEGGNGSNLHRVYKRYKLSDEKTFNSLFFPEKGQLLKLLKHFQDKSGKYQIEGYPHKLGLLLHGPPGTGKTSLIKAMAAHTKRHIVSIPLSRIKTNQELMDLVFDQVFHVAGEDLPQRLKFTDVIFVMEDVDAASTIVHARKPAPVAATTTVTITREASVGQQDPTITGESISRSNSAGGSMAIITASPGVKSSALKKEVSESLCLASANSLGGGGVGSISIAGGGSQSGASSSGTLKVKKEIVVATDPVVAVSGGNSAESDGDDDDGDDEVQGPEIDLSAALAGAGAEDAEILKTLLKGDSKDKKEKSAFGKDDKLDLAGLLNVLDGVIDCPGRIVIMTSNHPEKLDEALIRPGRIDKKILLDYLQDAQAVEMVQHYFQKKLTEAEVSHVKDIFKLEPKLTPAVLEQLCAEHEEIEDFLLALEKQARKRAVHHHLPPR